MVIERSKKPWLLGFERTVPMFQERTQVCPSGDVYSALTPNVLERKFLNPDGETKTVLYVREGINIALKTNPFLRMIGARDRIKWKQGPRGIDEMWANRERALTQHEWVGNEMVMWVGEGRFGIHPSLMAQDGFRVEKIRTKNGFAFKTTDQAWVSVKVVAGWKTNVVAKDAGKDIGTRNQLTIKVLEGKYEGREYPVSRSQLRFNPTKISPDAIKILNGLKEKKKEKDKDEIKAAEEALKAKNEARQGLRNLGYDTEMVESLLDYGTMMPGASGLSRKSVIVEGEELEKILDEAKKKGVRVDQDSFVVEDPNAPNVSDGETYKGEV